MRFTDTLSKNEDFRKVYKSGRGKKDRLLVVSILENGLERNRLGISVSKKVGNSVVRHRIKRLLRESYRLHEDMFHSGWDIVVVARKDAKGKSYDEICSSLLYLGHLQKIVKD